MLNVACVMQGDYCGRGAQYVEILHDMVRRNLAAGFAGRFVCFTDRPALLRHLSGVELRQLPPQLRGWWSKLYLFSQTAFAPGDRVLYFDLDTALVGPIDNIASYDGPFAGLRDVFRGRDQLQSSVMAWEAGRYNHIWERWLKAGKPEVEGGDQVWIQRQVNPAWLQDAFAGQLRSYKVECVGGPPQGTRVAFFHGEPRPHQAGGWVDEVWKVGGGSAMELVGVGTVAQDQVLANIRAALMANYPVLEPSPPNESTAMICAGGPSLAEQLPLIASLRAGGAALFACNAVDGFLRERQITPNFHVMLDARPGLARWINPGGIKLYASMCDPGVLATAAEVGELTVWHPITDGVERIVDRGLIVGGGTTVGIRAVMLAYAMGFRRILCFGFDSCYSEIGAHHAYDQALNDGERVIDVVCNGRKFRAAPWMVQQAEDFKRTTSELVRSCGCSISIYGDGLIAAMTALGRQQYENAQVHQYRQIDELWWPAHDEAGREAILATLPDLQRYISECPKKRCAVQAGGNVGVWPLELAKHFERVVTFEPDELNWHCLKKNVQIQGVDAYHAALGERLGSCGITRQEGNCGASFLTVLGKIPIVALDSLDLQDVDLLQLDVEGFELQALKGASQTIERCSPLIVLELKCHGVRYGYEDTEVLAWLAEHGYELVGSARRDLIFRRNHERTRAA